MAQIKTLITHSGSFHADDLFAYALLADLAPDAELLRTRDAALIAAAEDGTVVFDVGGVYDPETWRFDHHQPGKPLREDGIPYSSFGLVWKHFGLEYLETCHGLDAQSAGQVHTRLDRRFVRDIDALDNGVLADDQDGILHPMGICSLLADFRPDFDDDAPGAMDEAFVRASAHAGQFLAARIRTVAAGLRSEGIVARAIAERIDPRWIELPRGMPFLRTVLASGAEDLLFVVAPGDGEWQLTVVNKAEQSYEARQPLPEAWAGLRGDALVAATGIEDAVFCHTGRFVAIARSRAGIMALLDQALDHASAA